MYDTGLKQEHLEYLEELYNIEVVNYGMDVKSKNVHDEGWQKITYSKMDMLRDTIKKYNKPTLMIDCDSLFEVNFIQVLDTNADWVFTNTECRQKLPPNQFIGSFYGCLNPERFDIFYNEYQKQFEGTRGRHRESPSLTKAICILGGELRFQALQESQISHVVSSSKNIMPFIYHLKSDSGYMTIGQRLSIPWTQKYAR